MHRAPARTPRPSTRLRASGRLDGVKADLAQRQALDLIAESATPISVDQAKARDKLWTPGQERPRGRLAALDSGLLNAGLTAAQTWGLGTDPAGSGHC